MKIKLKKTIPLKISESQHEKIKLIAESNGNCSQQSVIRMIIDSYEVVK